MTLNRTINFWFLPSDLWKVHWNRAKNKLISSMSKKLICKPELRNLKINWAIKLHKAIKPSASMNIKFKPSIIALTSLSISLVKISHSSKLYKSNSNKNRPNSVTNKLRFNKNPQQSSPNKLKFSNWCKSHYKLRHNLQLPTVFTKRNRMILAQSAMNWEKRFSNLILI